MRRLAAAPLFAALAVSLAFAPALSAQSVAGTWELTWETPRGAQTVTFVFAEEGMNVTGTAQMPMGAAPIKGGMIHGDQLTFTLEFSRGERTMAQSFAATVKGDAMEGTITTPRGENPFKGVRKKG